MGGVRDRATSLLSLKTFRSKNSSPDQARNSPPSREPFPSFPAEAHDSEDTAHEKDISSSPTSNEQRPSSDGADVLVSPREPRRTVRVLPPWVQSHLDDDDDPATAPEDTDPPDTIDPASHLLPQTPTSAQLAHHNSNPSPKPPNTPQSPQADSGLGSAANAAATPHTTTSRRSARRPPGSSRGGRTPNPPGSRWRAFVEDTAYPPSPNESPAERVSEDWLVRNGPDYSQPFIGPDEPGTNGDVEKSSSAAKTGSRSSGSQEWWFMRFRRMLLRNPLIPLFLRLIVMGFSIIALGLGVQIFLDNRGGDPEAGARNSSQTSPVMAIVLDAVAPVYLVWITNDEYRGKPLGLRSATDKLRLILLDLLFIVFDSANLSLAFESAHEVALQSSLVPRVVTAFGDRGLQWALACVLLVALMAWLMTFAVSVLRLVERVER